MCRLLGWVAQEPITAREAIGEDGLAALIKLASLHADGWGIAYDGVNGPVVEKSTQRADTDPAFLAAVTTHKSQVGILHLRWATPGLPVAFENTHPFLHHSDYFAHNGAIYPVDQLDIMLSEEKRSQLRGTTDSEHYFIALQAALDQPGVDAPTAISSVTSKLARDFRPSSLNALMATQTALHAVSCHDPKAAPNPGAPVGGTSAETAAFEESHYFDLQYCVSPDAVVVASSGIATPEARWHPLPNDTLLVIQRGNLATQQFPLHSGLGEKVVAPATPTHIN